MPGERGKKDLPGEGGGKEQFVLSNSKAAIRGG